MKRLLVPVTIAAILAGCSSEPQQSAAYTAAQSFDRQLRGMAAYGDTANNNPNDTSPRKVALFLSMSEKNELPADLTFTLRGFDGKPVVAAENGTATVGEEKLDRSMPLVQISDGESTACVVVSETSNMASTIVEGECAF